MHMCVYHNLCIHQLHYDMLMLKWIMAAVGYVFPGARSAAPGSRAGS